MDLALLRELEDKPQDAIDLYRKVLAADPGNDTARKRLAELYVGQKKFDQALTELQQLERLETNPDDTRVKIGLLIFRARRLRACRH